ncbi:hypothetical protein Y025_5572 [Burkholderia pseudomallei TSV32]|nr:hypothetical protein Y025_5572 [Burkholderia pseudomallei TSV32]
MRALVVRAVLGNLLRARAKARHRHKHLREHACEPVAHVARQRHLVIEQAAHARHGRRLVHEIRKRHLDAPRPRLELLEHRRQHRAERIGGQRPAALLEQRDEARHVRALLIGGQMHVEIPGADGGLRLAFRGAHRQRMPDRAHADALDRHLPGIDGALHVGHREFGIHQVHLVRSL